MQEKIYEVLSRAVENGDISGANVLVQKNGEEQAYCECGFRDIENKVPLTRDTIFRLYSMTKPITAAAVMLLVSQGRIDLSGDLGEYLPEFYNARVCRDGECVPVKTPIKVRDLMNMTSGITYPDDSMAGRQSGAVFDELGERLYGERPMTTREFAVKMADAALAFEPGTQFRYGASADILGALVEEVSGMSFRDFLIENFFLPLGMNDTDFYVPKQKQERLAKVYDYSGEGLVECPTNHLGLRYGRDVLPAFQSGGAGLCSTLDDYANFAQMLLLGGRRCGKRILPGFAVHYLTHGGLEAGQDAYLREGWPWLDGYTYGNLMRVRRDGRRTTLFSGRGEYGWDGWLGMFFSNEPDYGITLLFGTQQIGMGRAATLVRKVKNIVMGELI
ncbi:MAG: beta-lactamase family protein [Lachnospiraceae bacterium]|nr:beta-lactamase family protein [Lachnospiraceae bacterium]